MRPQVRFHWNFKKLTPTPPSSRLALVESNPGQFGVREQAVRNLPPGGYMVNSVEVVMHHPEVIHTDVSELWASCNLTDRPNTRRSRLQPVVDLDISAVGQFHAGQLQAESLGIRSAPGSHQYVTTLQSPFSSVLFDVDANR